MGAVYRDLSGKNEVLFVYTQRWVPGRAFEAIGSLGGLTLASVVSARGYEGYSFAGITPKVVELIAQRMDRLYAVCFYCDFDNCGAICAVLKHFADAPFYRLVGGPHTMHLLPEDFSRFGADAIVCGDGEESIPAWLDAHRAPDQAPASLPQETTPEKKGEYEILSSFSAYPLPDDRRNLGVRSGLFSVITARGCPHRCAFCFEGGNSKLLRPRPVPEVLEEIRQRLERTPCLSYLFFADDTFTYDIRRLEEFCEGLREIRRTHELVWLCEGHASFFRRYPEAMTMMVEAGMVRMQIGMESGCDDVLAMYGKHIRAEDIRETARQAWQAGLPQLAGNFIVGGAAETEETARKTREFVLSLTEEFPGLLDISTTFPMPLSGTRLTEHPDEYHIRWLEPDFESSLEDVPVNRTDALTADQICNARWQLLHALLQKMRALWAAGQVPRDRVLHTVELYLRYGISDNWCGYVYRRDPALMAYAKAVLQQGFLPWEKARELPSDRLIPFPIPQALERLPENISDEALCFLLAADGRSFSRLKRELRLTGEALEALACEADRVWAMVYTYL